MSSLIAQYFLNHRLDLVDLEWQMKELAKAGYQGVYAHARQGLLTPYMSKDWWQAIDQIIEMCKVNGLEFRIWDEDYFPSGLAGGRVVWENQGFISQGLKFTTDEVEGGGPFELDFEPEGNLLRVFAIEYNREGVFSDPINVTAFCGTRRQKWTDRELKHGDYSPMMQNFGHPHWKCSFINNRFAISWQPPRAGKYIIIAAIVSVTNENRPRPNILNSDATKRFIELSHKQYLLRYGNDFGKTIKGVFTDEPSPGWLVYPWVDNFPEQFQSDHGYNLLDYLPHLTIDIDKRSPVVRHHYRLTQHRMQYQSYTEQISKWCEKNGIEMTGHLTRTEWLSRNAAVWPNELRSYKPIHIPHADPLLSAYGWPGTASYHTGLKVASSAAHLFKRKYAGSDSLAVVGDEASLRNLKSMLDYQMVMGINFFSIHGLHYSIGGLRKDQAPPSLFYQHTEWKYMPVLLNYLRKTCEKLTSGDHLCEIAVLYPSTSLACQIKPDSNNKWAYQDDEIKIHNLVEDLLGNHCDFDFIDEITLTENVDKNGNLTTPESYKIILLPYTRYIDEQTSEALLKYSQAGSRVIVIGNVPAALNRNLDKPQFSWIDDSVDYYNNHEEVLGTLPKVKVAGKGSEDIFILRRFKNNRIITFAYNRSENDFEGSITDCKVQIPGCGSILLEKDTAVNVNYKLPETISSSMTEDPIELSNKWEVIFEANHVPFNYWHVKNDNKFMLTGKDEPVFADSGFDLMQKEYPPEANDDGKSWYNCRFMVTGEISDAHLVLEESSITGNWKLYVNGNLITDWERTKVYDCRNLTANIGHAIKGNNTPTLNIITIETNGKRRGLKEVLYLYGSFLCEYKYAHLSLPFLKGSKNRQFLDNLLPWDVCGYPTFSGSAKYSRKLSIKDNGNYLLDLGRVEDIAEVIIDGKQQEVIAWPPYNCKIDNLSAGKHHLEVIVTNPPANRNRAAGLPSGLLGPVKLYRYK